MTVAAYLSMMAKAPTQVARGFWPIALAITLLLFVDGFDLFLIGKIAPAIADGFGRDAAAMEAVFTSHQIGLALGAFTVPVIADRFGSRRVLVISAALFGLGNLLSAMISDFYLFALVRGFCGVFMAGAMPVGLALLSEHLPKARLGLVLSIAMVGMSVGAAANSVVPAFMLDRWGWESGFILAGVLPFLVIPVLLICVPESQRFQSVGTAAAGQDTQKHTMVIQLASLFAGRRALMTLSLWFIVSLSMGQTALLAVWLPTFFQELGNIAIQDFALVATLTAVGGALGTIAIGWLQDRIGMFLSTALVYIFHAGTLVLLGIIPFGSWEFAVMFTCWSFFQSASIAGLNLLFVRLYPVEIRATGAGWSAGVGRLAGALTPAAGAMLLLAGYSLVTALAIAALPMAIVGLVAVPVLAAVQRRSLTVSPDHHPTGNRN